MSRSKSKATLLEPVGQFALLTMIALGVVAVIDTVLGLVVEVLK